jgi:hypothetical protein
MLHKLVFDGTDATSRAASAQVGAILYDKANDRMGVINAAQELTVHDADVLAQLVSGVAVTATDLDIRDLTHASDSIKVGDGTDFLAVNNDGSINATVSATDLDIRDLDFATDSIDVSGSSVSISGSVAVTQSTSPWVVGDGGGSLTVDGTVELGATTLAALETITVTATDLDIRDLAHTQDSIRLGDGTDLITSTLSGGKQALDVYVANTIDVDDGLADTAIRAVAETVGTSAAQIVDGGDELAARKYLWIYNNSNKSVYFGPTGVTTSSGYPIFPGSELHARIGAAVDCFLIGDAAGLNVRTLQAS